MSGLEFLGRVKDDPVFEGVPVLVCTGFRYDSEIISTVIEAGASGVLPKPIWSRMYQDIICGHLGGPALIQKLGTRPLTARVYR